MKMIIGIRQWFSINLFLMTIDAYEIKKNIFAGKHKHVPVASGSLKKCITTSGKEQFPWWQIEFPDIIEVKEITLQYHNNKYPLHDLRVSVGIEDISQINKDEVFEKNKIIKQIDGSFEKKSETIFCPRYCGGNFIIFQIVKPCDYKNCPLGNVLHLCNVTIKEHEEFDVDISINDRRGYFHRGRWKYNQSSIAFSGDPRIAKREELSSLGSSNYDSIFKWRARNEKICAVQKSFITFIEPGEQKIEDYYVTNFPNKYLVTKVKFETIDKKYTGFPSKEKFHMKIIIEGEQSTLCTEYKGFLSPKTKYEFECQNLNEGSRGVIAFVNRTSTQNIFVYCLPIEYSGHRVISVAKGKPTRQSSQAKGSVSSFVPVDGSDGWVLGTSRSTRRCVQTNGDDLMPWWRVDLLRAHFVTGITISASKREYWNDVLIGVGMKDISQAGNISIFTKNTLCSDLTNFKSNVSKMHLKCFNRPLGRFVSIQISKQCFASETCKENSTVLNLCGVEVYGLPVDIYYYGNIAHGMQLIQEIDESAGNTKDSDLPEINFGWMFLDFKDTAIVHNVILVPDNFNSSEMSVTFQVRVGFKEVDLLSRWDWIEDGNLCSEGNLTVSENNLVEIECRQNLVGANVFVQYNCTWIQNQTSCLDIRLFIFLEAWVLKIKPNLFVIKTIPETLDETFSYGWRDNETNHVVSKEIEEIREVESFPKCSYTIPGEDPYPWYQISLLSLHKVSAVTINNTNDLSHRRLHDVEIRVGIYDIMDAPRDHPFKDNQLCFSSGTSSLAPGGHKIKCDKPLIGFYLTIQIVKNCSDSSQCDVLEPNALQICSIEVLGFTYERSRPVLKNLSDAKTTKQSSRGE